MKQKNIIYGLVLLTLLLSNRMQAQTTDSTERIKKGWNLGGLPVVSYDSDLGLQLGVLANLYHYGDGSRYPSYDHSLYFEASWYTKGSGIFRFYYDSKQLIKGVRVSADISYIPDQTYSFYGFNGYQAVYNHHWEVESSPEYRTRVFYRQKREFFRVKLDFQGKITGHLGWLAGINLFNIYTTSVDLSALNRNKPESEQLPDVPGLYDHYVSWNIIPAAQAKGGFVTNLKLGMVYDTRDNEPNPMRGIWTEVMLISAPKPTSTMEAGFMKLVVTHRQYFTLIKKRLSFAYRLGLITTISGTAPYYVEPIMYMSKMNGAYSEGLGGAKTLRGILRDRVVGDGVAYGNFEFRWKFHRTQWLKQNFYFALITFFDSGRVIKDFDVEDKVKALNLTPEEEKQYFDFGAEGFHNSAGLGLNIAMNQNFVLSVSYGKALNPQDGSHGVYVGLNFLF